nr:hypothetical protein [Elizabethkingia argenteiflava]
MKSLGTSDYDLNALRKTSNLLKKDSTLNFRESRNGRLVYENKKIYRTEFHSFVLSAEEDFVRHDSGKVRNFYGLQETTTNTAFQSLLRFK